MSLKSTKIMKNNLCLSCLIIAMDQSLFTWTSFTFEVLLLIIDDLLLLIIDDLMREAEDAIFLEYLGRM